MLKRREMFQGDKIVGDAEERRITKQMLIDVIKNSPGLLDFGRVGIIRQTKVKHEAPSTPPPRPAWMSEKQYQECLDILHGNIPR
jgi:hypothetical protein